MGRSSESCTQTGAEGFGVHVGTQFCPKLRSSDTQTSLTGTDALTMLGEEMKIKRVREEEMKSEDEAIHLVFQRVYFDSTGMGNKLATLFESMLSQSSRKKVSTTTTTVVSKTIFLKWIMEHREEMKFCPGLKTLCRPSTWSATFGEMVKSGDKDRGITLAGMREWLMKAASVSRLDLMKGLRNDPILRAIVRWSESLHPLLRPREYHHVFAKIAGSAASSARISERELLAYVRESRLGSAEDATSETISSLFVRMQEEDGMIGKVRMLRIITGSDTCAEAEEVRAILRFSVSLRSLLIPRMWIESFDRIDSDHDGLLTYDEFALFIQERTSIDGEMARREEEKKMKEGEMRIASELTLGTMQKVKLLFDRVDVKKTGNITKVHLLLTVLEDEEYREMLRDTPPLRPLLRPGRWSTIFAKVDSDDDSKLNYGEFVEFVFASYANDLATSENSHGATFSVAMLRGVALGAGRVGATIGAVERSTELEATRMAELLAEQRLQDAVKDAVKKMPPPSWRLNLEAANSAAVTIQARWRGVEERMWTDVVRQEMMQLWSLNNYTTTIQSLWRGYSCRLTLGGDEEELWIEILSDSAKIIQRAFRAYHIRCVMGVGQARRDDIWIAMRSFVARDDAELTLKIGTLLWLRSEMIDPRTSEDGMTVSGWYQAQMFHIANDNTAAAKGEETKTKGKTAAAGEMHTTENDDSDFPGARLVPSNCVRRCSREERLQARQGRLPIWARLRCGRYKRDYYHNNLTGKDVWQKPKEFTEPHPMDVLRGLHLAPDVRGAVCMQRTWRHRVARQAHLRRIAFASGVLVKGWLIATDSRTNLPFWYNPADDTLTWEKPNVVGEEERLLAKDALESGRIAAKEQKRKEEKRRREERQLLNVGVKRKIEEEVGGTLIHVEFQEGPIGLHLKPRKGGGILITHVEPGCIAIHQLKRGYMLLGIKKKRYVPPIDQNKEKQKAKEEEKERKKNEKAEAKEKKKNEKMEEKERKRLEKEMKKEEKKKMKMKMKKKKKNDFDLKGEEEEEEAKQEQAKQEEKEEEEGPGEVKGADKEEDTNETGKMEENEAENEADMESSKEDAMYSINLDWSYETNLSSVLDTLRDTPRPITLSFVSLKEMRVAENTIKAEQQLMLGRKTVVVTFGKGSMGIEFAPRRKGGAVIQQLVKNGVAEKLYGRRLRRSMRLDAINARTVTYEHFDDIIDLLRTESRPIKLQFVSAPSRGPRARTPNGHDGRGRGRQQQMSASPQRRSSPPRGRRSRSPPSARRVRVFEVTFEKGPIGIEFVARRKGKGVLVKSIVEGSQAWKCTAPPMRKAMWLKKVGKTNVEAWSLSEVLARIASAHRPVDMAFATAPGKDWSMPERPGSTPMHSSTTEGEEEEEESPKEMEKEMT